MAEEVSGIWLACASMAARLTARTLRTSMVQVTSTVGKPSDVAASPRSPESLLPA